MAFPPHPAVQRMAQNMAIAERSLFDAGEVMTQFVVMASERVFLNCNAVGKSGEQGKVL